MADQRVNKEKRKQKINFYKFVGKVESQPGIVSVGNDKVVEGLNNLGSSVNGIARQFEEFKNLSAKNFLAEQKIEKDNKRRDKPALQKKKRDPFGGMVLGGIAALVAKGAGSILDLLGGMFKLFVLVPLMQWMSKEENREKLQKIIEGVISVGKFLFNVTSGIVMTTLDLIAKFTEMPFWKEILKGGLFLIALGTGFLAFKKLFGGKAIKFVVKMVFKVFKGFFKSLMWFSKKLLKLATSKGLRRGLGKLFGSKAGKALLFSGAIIGTGMALDAMNNDGVTGKDLQKAEEDITDDEKDQEAEIEGLTPKIQSQLDQLTAAFGIATTSAAGDTEAGGPAESVGTTQEAPAPTGQNVGGPQPAPEPPKNLQEYAGQQVGNIGRGVSDAIKDPRQAATNLKEGAVGAFNYAKAGFGNILGGKSFFDQEEQATAMPKMATGGSLRGFANGGIIQGPQTGYPVSLDGGASTAFIGHGTEMVYSKPGGSAFVVPYDTPATRGNKGLTARRNSEAQHAGFFSNGGSLGRTLKASGGANIPAEKIAEGQKQNAGEKEPPAGGGKILSVPYFNQRSNKTDALGTGGDSQCFSTSAAMVVSAILGKNILPDEYNKTRSQYGASTSMGAHPPAMKKFGVPASGGDFGSYDAYKSAINAGKPVILGLQHNSGSGHMVAGIGYRGNDIVVNDPYGKLNPTPKGGWAQSNLTSASDTKGRGVVYPKSLMDGIWVDRGPGTGRIVVPGKGGVPGGGAINSDVQTTGETSQGGGTNSTGADVKPQESVGSMIANLGNLLLKGAHSIDGDKTYGGAKLNAATFGGKDPEDASTAGPGSEAGNRDSATGELAGGSASATGELAGGSASVSGGFDKKFAALLGNYEGLRLKAYADANYGWEIPTIGIGATYYPKGFRKSGKVQKGDTITKDEAYWIKSKHIIEHRKRLTDEVGSDYNKAPNRVKAGLESVVFNYGSLSGAGIKDTVKQSLSTGNYAPVISAYRSRLASHNGGINNWRRNDEAGVMETGSSKRAGISFASQGGPIKVLRSAGGGIEQKAAFRKQMEMLKHQRDYLQAARNSPVGPKGLGIFKDPRTGGLITASKLEQKVQAYKLKERSLKRELRGEVVPASIKPPVVKPQQVKLQTTNVATAKNAIKSKQKQGAVAVATQTTQQNQQAQKQVASMSQPIPDKPIKVPVPKGGGGGRLSSDDIYNYRPGFGLFAGGF
ncbi:hypothetical protein Sn180910_012 [Cyanophage S-RIM14]|uniref:Lysozyme n=1 Tax=Cyanophage S-RIM14 TaxID=1278423 RepID=A0A1D7SMF6_9CAUD|nr:hypothetical protein Sn180910_012 [Cyanophage S-RIM14]AOO14858.1 hypothetical protein W1230910_012 [Cyanophage S-RIM14]